MSPNTDKEEASNRDHDSANGTFTHQTTPASPRTESIPTMRQKTAVSKEYNGDTPSIQDSTQQQMTSPPRAPSEREACFSEDGPFRPHLDPTEKADGTTSRPSGQSADDAMLDASEQNNATAGLSSCGKLSSHLGDSMSNGARAQPRGFNPSTPSSTGSLTASASETEQENGKPKHYTRSKGSGTRSLGSRQSESDYQNAVSL